MFCQRCRRRHTEKPKRYMMLTAVKVDAKLA